MKEAVALGEGGGWRAGAVLVGVLRLALLHQLALLRLGLVPLLPKHMRARTRTRTRISTHT